jgi:hypothetical protein
LPKPAASKSVLISAASSAVASATVDLDLPIDFASMETAVSQSSTLAMETPLTSSRISPLRINPLRHPALYFLTHMTR